MKRFRLKALVAALALGLAGMTGAGLTGCEDDDLGDELEDIGDDIRDGLEDAGDEIEDALD